mgnify:CR=1 FL=1
MRKKVGLFFIVLSLALHHFLSALTLDDVPKADKDILEKEFSHLFSEDLGYTLIGEKPMSLEYLCDRPWETKSHADLVIDYLDRVFEKSSKFAFFYFVNGGYRELILIHNPRLKELLIQEQQFFDRRLRRHVTAEWIIESLHKNRLDSVTLGVLLGYGKENSFFFKRRAELLDYVEKAPFLEFGFYFNNRSVEGIFHIKTAPQKSPQFPSYQAEWKWIQENDMPWPKQPDIPYLFQPVLFIAKKGKDTDYLHAKYLKAREKLAQCFYNESFLETVIRLANDVEMKKGSFWLP